MMTTDITLYLFILSLALSVFYILNKKSKGNLPPGPPKLPIIGNIHQITGGLPHHVFLDLAKKYGPIMHLQLGQVSTIVVSSPRVAREVLKINDLAFASRPYTLLADILLYGRSDVVFGDYGDYWRQMKKIITVEALSAKKVRSFSSIRQQEANSLIDFIRSACGKPLHLREEVMQLNNNIVCKSSFGNSCKQQDVLLEIVEEALRLSSGFHVADYYPKLGFLSVVSGMKSKLTKIHKKLDKIFNEMFEERKIKRQRTGASDEDLLDVLFNIKESGDLQFPFTDNNIKAIFVNMFIGGTDTSVVTIEWAMTEMMRNPEVMKKAQKEVREVFKGKTTIEETDLDQLVYLKCIIKEALRLHPPVPLLIPRECREQCNIDGYDIPVKTRLLINAFACSTDPEYWDDPKSFKPERFQNSSLDFNGANYEFIPFGAGRRICPGLTFGLSVAEIILAQMLYYYDWELPYGLSPNDIDMAENHGGVADKKVPLHIVPTLYSPIS